MTSTTQALAPQTNAQAFVREGAARSGAGRAPGDFSGDDFFATLAQVGESTDAASSTQGAASFSPTSAGATAAQKAAADGGQSAIVGQTPFQTGASASPPHGVSASFRFGVDGSLPTSAGGVASGDAKCASDSRSTDKTDASAASDGSPQATSPLQIAAVDQTAAAAWAALGATLDQRPVATQSGNAAPPVSSRASSVGGSLAGGPQLLQTLSLSQIGGLSKSAPAFAALGGASAAEMIADASGSLGKAADGLASRGASPSGEARMDAGAAIFPGDATAARPNSPFPDFGGQNSFGAQKGAQNFSGAQDDVGAIDAAATAAVAPDQAAALPQASLDAATQVLSVAGFETNFPAAIAHLLPATTSSATDSTSAAQGAAAAGQQLAALSDKPQQAIKTVSFQLAPEAYGAIDVRMRIINSRVELHLGAATPQAQALLRESRDKLAEAIGASGYTLDMVRIDVSPAPASPDTSGAQTGGGSQSFVADSNAGDGGSFAGRDGASSGQSGAGRTAQAAETERARGGQSSTNSRDRASGLYL